MNATKTKTTNRKIRWAVRPKRDNVIGIVVITTNDEPTEYYTKINGDTVTLEKYATQGGDKYTVDLSRRTCTCKSGTYRGRCKHVDGMTALLKKAE